MAQCKRRFARKKKMELREVMADPPPEVEDPLSVIRKLESQLAQERYTSNRRLAEQDNELQKLRSRNKELERERRKLNEKVNEGMEPYKKQITQLQEEKSRLKKSLKTSSRRLQEALRGAFKSKTSPAEEKGRTSRISRRRHKKEIRENAWFTTERNKFPFSPGHAQEESDDDSTGLLTPVKALNISRHSNDSRCPEAEEAEVATVDSLGNVWMPTRSSQETQE